MKQNINSDNSDFINTFSNFSNNIKNKILSSNNADAALKWAQVYGDLLLQNSSGIYSVEEIESFVEEKVVNDKRFILPRVTTGGGTVLLATELYSTGGHTELLLNWLKAFRFSNDHRLVVTNSVHNSVLKYLNDCQFVYYICKNKEILLINEICQVLKDADHVVLLIHPFDIVSTIVARVLSKAGKKIIFYNHADHVFSYAIQSSAVVCEVSTFGFSLNNRVGRAKNSCYLGIPLDFEDKAFLNATKRNTVQSKIVLSCGASYKYQPDEVFFGDFIDQLLEKNSNLTIYMVGATGSEPWWDKYINKWADNVKFFGSLSREKYSDLLEHCDLYVDSFPITGGTAFPLALVRGKPVTGLSVKIQGYSAIDVLRESSVSNLVSAALEILNENPERLENIKLIREKILHFSNLLSFQRRVKAIYERKYSIEEIPNIQVDTYYFENQWKNRKKIFLPFDASVNKLNIHQLFYFFKNMVGISKYIGIKMLKAFFYQHFVKGSAKRCLNYVGIYRNSKGS